MNLYLNKNLAELREDSALVVKHHISETLVKQ